MADMQTFIHEWLLPVSSGMGPVNMDDGATFLARFVNGAMDTFVSSLYATTRRNHQRVKMDGDQGHWFTRGRTPTIVKRL